MMIKNKTNEIVYRNIETKLLNLRTENTETNKLIRGYAVLFNVPTPIYGEWKEVIDPLAFEGVDISDMRMLINHDRNMLLGKNGINLKLEIDSTGLYFELKCPNTTIAADTYELVKTGILDAMSFAFWSEKIETDGVGKIDRIMKFKKVPEVSLVTFPAYPQTVAIAKVQEINITESETKDNATNNPKIDENPPKSDVEKEENQLKPPKNESKTKEDEEESAENNRKNINKRLALFNINY